MMIVSLTQLAYRYAYDIDFIQFGNEVFGGPGEYAVETSCHEGLWPISLVDGDCYGEACQQVIDWMEVQIEVARMASALAGRPLRFVTPAFSIGHVITGKDGDLREPPEFDVAATRAAFAVQCIIGLGNAQQAWVDLHLHYDEDGQLEDALYYFTTPNQYTWDVPAWRTSLEWSSKPTETWVNNAMPEYRKYFDALETPTMLWDDFVYDWGENNLRVNFPDFANDLTEIESYGLLHACYGEFQQGIVPKEGNPLRPVPDEFDLTVVRANAVRPHEDWIADYTNLFTTIRGDLEEDNTAYLIPSFTPHPNAPTSSCACVPRP